MESKMKAIVSATAIAFTAAVSGAAFAQAQQQPGAQQQEIQPVTEEEIKQFARAEQKIATIAEKWQEEMDAVESQEAAEQIQQQAQAEMIAAVEQEGLTAERYNEIYAQAQMDPELAEQIRSST